MTSQLNDVITCHMTFVWNMIIHQRVVCSVTYPCASFSFPIGYFLVKITCMKYQSRLFRTDFMLILYKKVIFKNGLETCQPYSNSDLFCVHSDKSLRRPF